MGVPGGVKPVSRPQEAADGPIWRLDITNLPLCPRRSVPANPVSYTPSSTPASPKRRE